MTTAEETFELSLQGVEIPSPANFEVPELQLTAELKDGVALQLTVRVMDVSEQERTGAPTNSLKSYTSGFWCILAATSKDLGHPA